MTIGPAVSKWMIKMLKKEDGQTTDNLITQRELIGGEISKINAQLKRLKDCFESPANADNELTPIKSTSTKRTTIKNTLKYSKTS